MSPWIVEEQINRNRDSRDSWLNYGTHRERITSLLTDSALDGERLLLLGAGNCNDVDLRSLLDSFSEIHLVDIDAEALNWGVSRQNMMGNPQIFLHGGVDVTGIATVCSKWRHSPPRVEEELTEAMRTVQAHTLFQNDQSAFDVCASLGLLSQLIEMIIKSLGMDHPRCLELMSATRLRHMQILFESVRPGGRVLLVTEIVSSDTCPELLQISERNLLPLLRQAINARNFFTGLNPAVLESIWRKSIELSPLIENVEMITPWLWNFGPRVYACYALRGVRCPRIANQSHG